MGCCKIKSETERILNKVAFGKVWSSGPSCIGGNFLQLLSAFRRIFSSAVLDHSAEESFSVWLVRKLHLIRFVVLLPHYRSRDAT